MILRIKAHAKVNLYLKVLRKRSDGYHEIETLFERVSLFDELVFRKWPAKIELKCHPKNIVSKRDNLVYRAADLLKKKYDVREGVFITLKKNIPIAAGLGGGSSDAAATLMALSRFWCLGLNQEELLAHAAELGSDVPFFVLGTPFAIGKGRGEKLQAIRSRVKLWHVLVMPSFSVFARQIYNSLDSSDLTLSQPNVRLSIKSLPVVNTLERVILRKYKKLQVTKDKLLDAGARGVLVSGSGPSLFGLAHSKAHATLIARKLRKDTPFPIRIVSTF